MEGQEIVKLNLTVCRGSNLRPLQRNSSCNRVPKWQRRSPRGRTPFQIRLGAWHTRPLYFAALRFVRDYLWRRLAHFKLSAHFLYLRGLLFQLRRQNLHSFLLLRDGGFQFLQLSYVL